MGKQVGGCSQATLRVYDFWLERLRRTVGDESSKLDAPALTAFLAALRSSGVSPSTIHQAYRTLKTFCRWLRATGVLDRDPLAGLNVRTPATLPRVPTEDELRAVLATCHATFEGLRNRAMILVMADAGLRAMELLRLLVEDWNSQERSLFIRSGKGQKDRVTFIAPTTVRAIREYLAMRQQISREDFLFVDMQNQPLKPRHLVQILHRLSGKAGLSLNRRLHPHVLRHFAATSWLRNGVGLDQVRRLLGHASLHTTLRYSNLVAADLQKAHKDASAIERIGMLRGQAFQRGRG